MLSIFRGPVAAGGWGYSLFSGGNFRRPPLRAGIPSPASIACSHPAYSPVAIFFSTRLRHVMQRPWVPFALALIRRFLPFAPGQSGWQQNFGSARWRSAVARAGVIVALLQTASCIAWPRQLSILSLVAIPARRSTASPALPTRAASAIDRLATSHHARHRAAATAKLSRLILVRWPRHRLGLLAPSHDSPPWRSRVRRWRKW